MNGKEKEEEEKEWKAELVRRREERKVAMEVAKG